MHTNSQIHNYVCTHPPRATGSTQAKHCCMKTLGDTATKRVLEYGIRAPVFYGNLWSKRERTVFHESLQESCFVLTEISENLRETSGSLWENVT